MKDWHLQVFNKRSSGIEDWVTWWLPEVFQTIVWTLVEVCTCWRTVFWRQLQHPLITTPCIL
jgi:hypothetical protein